METIELIEKVELWPSAKLDGDILIAAGWYSVNDKLPDNYRPIKVILQNGRQDTGFMELMFGFIRADHYQYPDVAFWCEIRPEEKNSLATKKYF